jgi:UDP-glucose:(heptosyl)LPS alpha-1,3-glucosyltransferase
MSVAKHKIRLAVVSPFLDKSHGTERIAVEWIARVAGEFEVHIYSQCVEDLDVSRVVWHRIPRLRGPHVFNFVWWFAANHIWRAWDRRFRGLAHDLTYSPGVNCLDADAISVHIVFAEFLERVRSELKLSRNRLSSWPRLLHRKLYYHLIIAVERWVYSRPQTQLILTARRSASEIERCYGRRERFPVIEAGLDHEQFNPARRLIVRKVARQKLGIADGVFTLLLIGNDWRKKGLLTLLDALAQLGELPIHLLVVSLEVQDVSRVLQLRNVHANRVSVLPVRRDVEFYYAATDAYVGPSLEDTFALPVAEAMACGLPVIASRSAGVSDIITHGVDGLVLDDPKDATRLAEMIGRLFNDEALRTQLGDNAADTARQFTWERNGRELAAVFEEILRQKNATCDTNRHAEAIN